MTTKTVNKRKAKCISERVFVQHAWPPYLCFIKFNINCKPAMYDFKTKSL